MNDPHDPNVTADIPPASEDSLDAGLAAGFGRPAEASRPTRTGWIRPMLLKEAEGESSHIVKPNSDAMPHKSEAGDRYRLDGEIARGGMGAVLRGRDVELGRDLAVKVLLEKYVDRPEIARRFFEEAQIGGQLQHPGVVPVYDIGHFGDRPFFTMKLVKGLTLAAILSARAEPTVDRPRLLGIALQVTQTLAYSHAKGVIHRDLKPANVMVGAFGEVQVMDWGLAKVLAEGGIADEERASRGHQVPEDVTTIRTARSSGSAGSVGSETEAGSLLGTPAYMPPEQANGDTAHLDRRADVFGLGALLCEILTGQPPYVGRSGEEVRRMAANGDLADATARLDACGAEAELVALTKKCLSPEAIDRPKDAQEVADGLSAYLNGVQERLQAAERERAVAVAREAEQRKKRKVQLALAAAVAGLLLVAGAFAFWRNEQAQLVRQREARNVEAVVSLLNQAEEALKVDDAAKAAVVLEAAKKRSAEGGAEMEADRLKRLDTDLTLLRDLDAVDQFRWTVIENHFPDPTLVATRTREALTRFGSDPDGASADDAAVRVSASVVRGRIVSALDRLLWHQKTAGVRTLLRKVDADPYRNSVRDAMLASDPAKFVELAGQSTALEQPPGFVALLGESGSIPVERRRQLLSAAVSRRPGNLGLVMTLAGTYPYVHQEWTNEQLRWYQAAVAIAPNNAAVRNCLGNVLSGRRDLAAEADFREAIRIDPTYAAAYLSMGLLQNRNRRWDKGIVWTRQAIALDPKNVSYLANLGWALMEKGQLDEAIDCFRRVIAVNPNHHFVYSNLGEALQLKGHFDEAMVCQRRAIELDPKNGLAFSSLGTLLLRKREIDEAIACFRKAAAIYPDFTFAFCKLGKALALKGQIDEAIATYKRAIQIDPNLSLPHYFLGQELMLKGQMAEAIICFKQAIALEPKNEDVKTWLKRAERLEAVRNKFVAFQNGSYKPDNSVERLNMAEWCQIKKLHHSAAGLYAAAFAADPKLADDLKTEHRYNAACNAALAAAGQGGDSAKLDDKERSRLRMQALDWLRTDLALRTIQLESDNRAAAQQALHHWQQNTNLASVRDTHTLAKLPADEQKAFTQMWADVAALLKKAQDKPK